MSHPVYLVRHGESEWNVLRLTQGQVAHPRLTSRGRDQARSAASMIATDLAAAGLRTGRILSSDLVRAAETAVILRHVLGGTLDHDRRLREQHLGDLEGRTYEETFAAADALDWSTSEVAIGGGETLRAVQARMADVFGGLDRDRVNVLVSHGDSIRPLLAHLDGVEPHQATWTEIPNGSVARIDGDDKLSWLPPL